MSQELIAENLQLREQLRRLIEQARQNQHILQRHQDFDLQLIAASGFRELIDTVLDKFAQMTNLDAVSLLLLDSAYEIRRILTELNIDTEQFPRLLFLPDASPLKDLLTPHARPRLGACDTQLHAWLFPEVKNLPASVAIVPLVRHGTLIGCLNFGSHDRTRFVAGMGTDFIEHLASLVAICLENVINHERLKHLGLTDTLTGVNNRRYMERRLLEEVGRSRRHDNALCCMYIDIDHFKRVNDTAGHLAGDEVLREVASRIKAELRMSDALGRFGGEEFIVLLIDAVLEDAVYVAERIRRSIAETPLLRHGGKECTVTVSVGVAELRRGQTGDASRAVQDLMERADRALYRAKNSGRNKVAADY